MCHLIHNTESAISIGFNVDVAYGKFSKAFDKVNQTSTHKKVN